ncbi:RDD family protein [Aureimonas pseudogalii]|uniref:Putative RDD family membrane protein YckC n=1 Tax=Aureimonas pseudogalii TaxID=1744844 RepID=A0A7W6H4W3_9HYPH|nr:RDD family protein [Aureimonas pseudogalii]MBB3998599.1 putative RDD family membrane protein YckC [Aureimonas pseudogalii]
MTALNDTTPTWLDEPRAYRSVRTRRVLSFFFDYTLVLLLCVPVYFVVTLLGVVTLGLGFLLYGAIFPLVAIPYVAFTMGGAGQATPGMRLFDLRIERLDGRKVDPTLAVLHGVLFWAGNVLTSGFIVLLALFTPRKQLVQDLLLGTVVTRRS